MIAIHAFFKDASSVSVYLIISLKSGKMLSILNKLTVQKGL